MTHPLYKWIVLVTVSLANFSATLDVSILLVSFPRLVEVFQTDTSVVLWLSVAYTMAQLGLVLTLARVGDSVGRKKVFVIGLILYTLGLILCSVSQNISQLIAARVIQGAGAAMGMTIGGAIVVAVFPEKQQGRAIGIFSMLVAIGLISGPAIGGLILDYLDWRGIFYIRIPIGVIALLISVIVIKEQQTSEVPLKLDIGGAITLLGFTSSFLLVLNLGSHWGYSSAKSLLLLSTSVILFILFIRFERRAQQPVLQLSFFKNRTFTLASAASFVQMVTCVGGPMLIPFFLLEGLKSSQSAVGLLMTLIALPHSIFSSISGWLSEKTGNRPLMVLGGVVITLGIFGISRLDLNSTQLSMGIVLVVFGLGMGIFNSPNQSAIVGAVSRQNLATAMGVANTVRVLGSSVGTALIGTVYASLYLSNKRELTSQILDAGQVNQLSVVNSIRIILMVMAGISLLTIILSAGTREKEVAEIIQ